MFLEGELQEFYGRQTPIGKPESVESIRRLLDRLSEVVPGQKFTSSALRDSAVSGAQKRAFVSDAVQKGWFVRR